MMIRKWEEINYADKNLVIIYLVWLSIIFGYITLCSFQIITAIKIKKVLLISIYKNLNRYAQLFRLYRSAIT